MTKSMRFNATQITIKGRRLLLKKENKYKAKKTTINGQTFHSKKEANRYLELQFLQKSGEVAFFLTQVPLRLPGKVKYIADFVVFWSNKEVSFEDVKGKRTPLYITKKKIVESIYPITIQEL